MTNHDDYTDPDYQRWLDEQDTDANAAYLAAMEEAELILGGKRDATPKEIRAVMGWLEGAIF